MKKEVLRLEDVTYKKNNTIIFRNMMLHIMAGEIVGLEPLNTYGLDELFDVIINNAPLYHGYVYYQEHCVNSWKEARHGRNRICMIDSESSLVSGLNVVTNVFTLRSGFGKEILDEKMLAAQLQPFLDEIHVSIDPFVHVEKLSVYKRVLVEILRAVVAGYRLIILREISTVISETELEKLYEIMRYYSGKGFSFLYVSFHFEEIQQVCSRAFVMSDGSIDMVLDKAQIQKGIDKAYFLDYYNHVSRRRRHRRHDFSREVLEVRDMTGEYLQHFRFQVYQGECLVIQSLDTKIYLEFLEMFENENRFDGSRIFIDGEEVKDYRTRQVAFLKEKPSETMLFQDMTVCDNLCIGLDGKLPVIWRRKKIRRSVQEEYYRIFHEDIFDQVVSDLTDEQKMKVAYMRVLLEKPEVVFIVQPFKHVGIAGRMLAWELQALLLERGISVVILAMNMSDSLTIADRVIRVSRLNGKMVTKELTPEHYGELPVTLPWVGLLDEMEKET